jgi:hypothetical protein
MNIIHSPSTIPQMSTDRMSEVVGLHDGSEGVHESFKTAVDEGSVFRDRVDSIAAYESVL